MGIYINPPDMTKEQFLTEVGTPLDGAPAGVWSDPDTYPVCWMDNGPFTAAAIVYNERERDAMTLAEDGRPKQWYTVPRAALFLLPGVREQLGDDNDDDKED